MHAQRKNGTLSQAEFYAAETGMSRSTGTCNTMGTASTMACIVEALGMSLSENAAIPAVDSRRKALAHMVSEYHDCFGCCTCKCSPIVKQYHANLFQSGMMIVDMVKEDVKPSSILTREAFENAIKVLCAIGG